MANVQPILYTIGHSTHSLEKFIALLKQQGITALCDVRSKPYSCMNPQFNRENLKRSLRENGIAYIFLGKELGARSEDPSYYVCGKVQYDRLARSALFQKGIIRVRSGMRDFRLALMCAEKDPLECHRTILESIPLLNVESRYEPWRWQETRRSTRRDAPNGRPNGDTSFETRQRFARLGNAARPS
jgi:uncharacterized protein (DUF488 family)